MSQIVHVFPNSDLRSGHKGLRAVALRGKRNPDQLDNGHFILFINRAQSAFKLLAAGNLLIHYKSPKDRMIDIKAIRYLPAAFTKDGKFDYNIAVQHSLKEWLGKRYAE